MKVIERISPVLLYFLIIISTLTETIYSAALPNITNHFNTQGYVTQLSTTVYYIGFAIGIFTLGRVSDIYGRRPVILFGIAFYIIATFLITISKTIEFFIAMRIFQAYGASVGSVVAQSMARDSYKGWELSYIYASCSMIMSITPSIGSAIGGYMIEYLETWQYIFYFLICFASFLLIFYSKFLPETNPYIGISKEYNFYEILIIALSDKSLLVRAFIVGAYNGICLGFYIQAPFIFIDQLDMNPSNYGKLFLILSAASVSGSIISRHLIGNFISINKIQLTGLVLSFVACILLLISSVLITESSSILFIATMILIPMSIHSIGHAFIVPMLLRDALENYEKVKGAAGSIFGLLYYVITAFVTFMISNFHSTSINNYSYLFAVLLITCIFLFLCCLHKNINKL